MSEPCIFNDEISATEPVYPTTNSVSLKLSVFTVPFNLYHCAYLWLSIRF